MKDAYTKLMLQQHTSAEGDADFFEKLQNTGKKPRAVWKAAVIAACILLMIPVTVWAAESIFGITKVTYTHRPDYYDKPGIGLDIVFENIEDYPIEAFSDHLQELKDFETVLHESWADAEEYLGIDLLDNVHFTAKDTYCKPAFIDSIHTTTGLSHQKYVQLLKRFGKNAKSLCWTYDEQLVASSIKAEYERDQTIFIVEAMVSVDLPDEMKEVVYNYYHGYSITYVDSNNTQVETQQYMTKAGIPVLIVATTSEANLSDSSIYNDWEDLIECVAFFAVNDVTYRVNAFYKSFGTYDLDRYASPVEKVMPALLEFLDGFVIE